MRTIDRWVFRFCHQGLRCRLLDACLPWMTHLGSAVAAIGVTLGVLLVGLISGNEAVWRAGCHMALALMSSHVVVHILKHWINRPRPHLSMEGIRRFNIPICPYSFPSGHTNAAVAIAVAAWGPLPALGMPIMVMASLVGFSRVYLGVHYISDVSAGGLIGLAFGLLANRVAW